MHAQAVGNLREVDSALATDAQMVSRMRVVLSAAGLFAVSIDPAGMSGIGGSTLPVFALYLAYSVGLYICSQLGQPFSTSKWLHWLDVCWIGLIVLATGGLNSLFFLFFFFAILTSAFRWGFDEGARITLASAGLFAACGVLSVTEPDLPRLLLRTIFLLTLGYMSVYWGESIVRSRRQLALLRDVSTLANPRFGVDQTIITVLQKTCAFFDGTRCILVLQDHSAASYSIRTVDESGSKQSTAAEQICAQVAAPLMAFSPDHTMLHTRQRWPLLSLSAGSLKYSATNDQWTRSTGTTAESLAELLEAHSFISAPLTLRKGEGRIYVAAPSNGFTKADALFLGHIVAQAFPVIENIELLDRMASEAAAQERQKMAWNLHDTALQPYIGLRLALSAVRNKASASNPLVDDLDKLSSMTSQVIGDLRQYVKSIKDGAPPTEPMFLDLLRGHAAQLRKLYGIEIEVRADGELDVGDRLSAEVLQVVREGLSNICKHTAAHRGQVKLKRAEGWLNIQIENEGMGVPPVNFVPRSITERATALGGNARVQLGPLGHTAVHIAIPV